MFKHSYTLNLGRITTILVAALLVVSCSTARKAIQAGSSEATAYLADEELPDATVFLPSPTKPGDPLFQGDLAYYAWGKTVRDSQRGTVAHDDASSSMTYIARRFEPALGFLFSADTTPNLLRLLSKSYTTTNNANKKAKDYYKRKRPYVEFSEPTGVPEGERGSRNSASYPSGHATRGWTMALVLAELFPEKAEEILKVGYEYGESRVIVGYHYQSDVDAARIAAAAALAVVHANPEFQNDMELARQELKKLGYLK
ncbi:MAG: phosphatase PAP2 family protein [Bacteroidales bacterium]|nr:phosphatase PAP2 family protein [Bacteroidales bacterium]